MGALLGGPYSIPLLVDQNGAHIYKESSAHRDSDNSSCSEASQIGASGQNPVEQGAGETPLIG